MKSKVYKSEVKANFQKPNGAEAVHKTPFCHVDSSVLPASALLPTVYSQASCQSDPVLIHVKPCYFCARNRLISFSFTQRKNQRPCLQPTRRYASPPLPLVTSMTSFTPSSSLPGLQPSLLLSWNIPGMFLLEGLCLAISSPV